MEKRNMVNIQPYYKAYMRKFKKRTNHDYVAWIQRKHREFEKQFGIKHFQDREKFIKFINL